MDVLASSASNQDHSFVVGVFGEGADLLCFAFGACETENVQFAVLGLHSGNAVHY